MRKRSKYRPKPVLQNPLGFVLESITPVSLPIEGWLPLYTTPPQRTWVGLTGDEVKNLCLSVGAEPIEVRFIEAKLKEKNT